MSAVTDDSLWLSTEVVYLRTSVFILGHTQRPTSWMDALPLVMQAIRTALK